MSRVVADARLSAEVLLALRRVNRSACAASRIRDYFGCGGGGRFGDCELNNQSFFKTEDFHSIRIYKIPVFIA
jgi:hypothetical protein